ncbi:MAG: nucleotidyl transferase [Thiotrichaceae bacterium]|nr:MAG: nucleotidyl transferase [Thiotrichaceae bacterium]
MPKFLHLTANERKDILQTAAAQLGQQTAVLEKDVWVCWALQSLFSLPNAHPMAFKGGTSLSKVYKVINRFSEDVDVTIDYRAFGEDIDPFSEAVSNTAIRKYSDRLKEHVNQYANNIVIPHIENQLQQLPNPEDYGIEVSDDGEKIWIQYPSAVENNDDYLKSSILIELGGRNVTAPNEQHTITADIASLVTKLDLPQAEVTVLSPERTFWEKATLIHVECNRKTFKENSDRLSRHWYDMVMLAQHETGKKAINNRVLYEDVIRHKKVFFNATYANYDACLEGKLCLVPGTELTSELKKDYEKMLSAGMLYGEPPSFDEIIRHMQVIEKSVNHW